MHIIYFILIFSQNLAPGRNYPWGLLPWSLGFWSWWIASFLFFIGLVFILFSRTTPMGPDQTLAHSQRWDHLFKITQRWIQSRFAIVLLVLGNLALTSLNYLKFHHLGYAFPWASLALCVIALFLLRRERTAWAFLFNLLIFVFSILYFPVTGFRSDMLPVNEIALNAWWNHQDPYLPIQAPWGPTGMPYFPGILFSHFPAWFLGLDLRWGQLIYRIIWLAGLWKLVKKTPQESLVRDGVNFYLLSPYLNFRHDLYFEIFFVWSICYFIYPRLRILWITLLAVTTQWALILYPFLVTRELFSLSDPGQKRAPFFSRSYSHWVNPKQMKHLLKQTLIGLTACFGVGILIWILLAPSSSWLTFKTAAFGFQSKAATFSFFSQPHLETSERDFGLNLSGGTDRWGGSGYLMLLQIFFCVWIWLKDFIEQAQGRSFTSKPALLNWMIFVLASTHFWNYFWLFPVFWFLLFWLTEEPNSDIPNSHRVHS